jgi:hypothetical protein
VYRIEGLGRAKDCRKARLARGAADFRTLRAGL